MGKTIAWSVKAETAGTYKLIWRYAFGGLAANTRDGRLVINGVTAADAVTFAYTTDWNMWQETPALDVQLSAGSNFIQIVALGASGLANIDYLEIVGEGITPDNPSFSLTVASNDVRRRQRDLDADAGVLSGGRVGDADRRRRTPATSSRAGRATRPARPRPRRSP
jgi:hypothetical protein